MQTRLPDKIDLWKLARSAESLQGEIPLQRLARLQGLLCASDGTVTFTLTGGIDEQGIRFVTGHLSTRVELICQRCLAPLALPLDVDLHLGLVHSESQAADLPKDYDPLLAPAEGVALNDIVEEELLLALPLIPKHADKRYCATLAPAPSEPAQTRPFAALATLLHKE